MFTPAPAFTTLTTFAAMALDTIIELADTFLDVLPTNAGRRVLMASVTGIATIVVANMTGHTAGVVITIQFEIFIVIECCWHPLFFGMALAAITGDLPVQRVVW